MVVGKPHGPAQIGGCWMGEIPLQHGGKSVFLRSEFFLEQKRGGFALYTHYRGLRIEGLLFSGKNFYSFFRVVTFFPCF